MAVRGANQPPDPNLIYNQLDYKQQIKTYKLHLTS
jgi:hypothetical protein